MGKTKLRDSHSISLTKVIKDDEYAKPVLVEFQNGQLKDESLQTAVLKTADDKMLLAVANERMLYTGTVDDDEDCDYYMLISDPDTDEGRLIHTDHAVLAPYFFHNTDKTDGQAEAINSSNVLKLKSEFGSKRTKRIAEQRERLKTNAENVKERLEQTIANIEVEEYQTNTHQSDYIPKVNQNATEPNEAYNLEEILPQTVLDALQDEAENLLNDDLTETNTELCDFVKRRMTELQDINTDMDKLHLFKILVYINYLIRFITTQVRQLTKTTKISQIKNVNNHILDSFTVLTARGRARSLPLRDKTLCHIIILSMMTMKYTVNLQHLATEINIGIKKLQDISRVLCFSQMGGANKHMITLKIPLPAPLSLQLQKKRKTL